MPNAKRFVVLNSYRNDIIACISENQSGKTENTMNQKKLLTHQVLQEADKKLLFEKEDEIAEYSGLRVPPIRDRIPANRAMIPLCFQ